jgi:hypothetical protein
MVWCATFPLSSLVSLLFSLPLRLRKKIDIGFRISDKISTKVVKKSHRCSFPAFFVAGQPFLEGLSGNEKAQRSALS